MRIRLWGSQGSLPSPLSPDDVKEKIIRAILQMPELDTNDPDIVRAYVEELPPLLQGTAKGNTSCVEVQAAGETLIIDAGTGIRKLGLELMKGPCGQGQGKLHILFSHPHWDHIQGFPFFIPAFVPGNQITFYSIHDMEMALTEQQRYLFIPVSIDSAQAEQELAQMGPEIRSRYGFIPTMQAQREFVRLGPGAPFSIGPVTINTLRNHHPGDAYSYRFEDQHSIFVYASDSEYKELDANTFEERVEFFRNADAVLFDAQYGLRDSWENKVDYGHSSAMIGVDFARRAGAKRLLLSHHEPTYADEQLQEIQNTAVAYQSQDSTLPTCEVIVGYEGLELDLAPPGAIEVRADEEAAVLTPGRLFDEQSVTQLISQMNGAAHSDAALDSIVDLSQVERLTTASLKMLVTWSRQQERGPVVLAAPSATVQEVIKLGGYGDYFAIYPTVEEAVKAVQTREALNLPGQIINDQYRIIETLGQSAVGTLLKVFDQINQRQAALRILSPAFEPKTIEYFISQIDRLLDLDHRFLTKVYDSDWSQEANHCFVVEELVVGQSLLDRLAGNGEALSMNEAMDLAFDLTLVLEYVHRRGIIHGNLRPQDVFLTEAGIKVSGFNLARLEEGRKLLEAPVLYLGASHLAPEQILGQPLDARTDLYALGVILYQMFTGRLLFEGSDHDQIQAHLGQSPTRPRDLNPAISRSVEHFILKLLAKNPNERYASAQQAGQIFNSLLFGSGETGQPARQYLVGRATQLQTLLERWQLAEAGHGQLLFVTGEPGIGKTSLTRQVALQSKAPIVLVGGCQEEEGRPAYQPFREILQNYFSTVPPEISEPEMRRMLSHVSDMVPELRQIIPDLPQPAELEPQQAQMRLISSLTQFIKRATQERPWLLILDDLQWVDEASIELLHYLGRHLDLTSLMILGTYRTAEVGSDHLLQKVLRELSQSHAYLQLHLDRLGQGDVANMLAHLWDPSVPEPLCAAIYQHTEGNPLYVEEVAKGLMDDGLVTMQSGQWHFPGVEDVRLPNSVYEAVERRVHYLNAETRDVLSQAAVLGQTFRFDDILGMSGISEWTLLDHLDLAMERQLVQEVGGDETLRFRHSEIHHVLYHDLGALRRRRLHHRAGEAIEQRAKPEPQRFADELAHHFSEAGELKRALVYSIPAAQQAQEAYANETALHWYERSLDMLDQLSPGDSKSTQSQRLSLFRSMGELLHLMGQWDEAYRMLKQALDLAEEIGDRSAQAWFQTDLSNLFLRQGRFSRALESLAKAEDLFMVVEELPGLAQVFHYRGTVAAMQGDYETARVEFEAGLEIRQKLNDKSGMGMLFNNLGVMAKHQSDFAAAQTFYKRSLAIQRQLNDSVEIATLLNNLGELAFAQGDYDTARTYSEEAVAITREIGAVYRLAVFLHTLADIVQAQGDYSAAKLLYQESILIYRNLGDRNFLAEALEAVGSLEYLQEHPERSLRLMGAAEALRDSIDAIPEPAQKERLDKVMMAMKQELGEEAAAAIIEEGKVMSLEETIRYAMQEE